MKIPKLFCNVVHKFDDLMISGFESLSPTSSLVLFNLDGSNPDFTSSVRQTMTTGKKKSENN